MGLEIRWEDDAKSLQSLVHMKPEMFSEFKCGVVRKFGILFSQLLDTLVVFSSVHAATEISYPGPNGELMLEMRDESWGPECLTYAKISSLETPAVQDLEEYWEEPVSYFLCNGVMMKEAADDLEWPNSAVELRMVMEPERRLVLSASGSSGGLEVELPVGEMSGFVCSTREIRHTYSCKSLKAAFSNLPGLKDFGDTSTKVSIDAQGMLKVTHVIRIHTVPLRTMGGTQGLGGFMSDSSQHPASDLSRAATVHFFLLPLADA